MKRSAPLAVLLVLAACKPGGIGAGSVVTMDYALTVDGKPVDASRPGEPFQFEFGAGQVVPGLEQGLKGLRAGEEKTLTVPAELGYGPRDPTAIQLLQSADFGSLAKDLRIGSSVQGMRGGKPAEALVVALDSATVTLDFNHRLSGKTLVFKVKIVSVDGK